MHLEVVEAPGTSNVLILAKGNLRPHRGGNMSPSQATSGTHNSRTQIPGVLPPQPLSSFFLVFIHSFAHSRTHAYTRPAVTHFGLPWRAGLWGARPLVHGRASSRPASQGSVPWKHLCPLTLVFSHSRPDRSLTWAAGDLRPQLPPVPFSSFWAPWGSLSHSLLSITCSWKRHKT